MQKKLFITCALYMYYTRRVFSQSELYGKWKCCLHKNIFIGNAHCQVQGSRITFTTVECQVQSCFVVIL